MMILRPYQQNACHWVNRMLNNSKHPATVMPTGTGKTAVIGQVVKDRIELKKRLLVIVPSLEIHEQFMTHFSKIGLNPGYINDEGIMGRKRSVYVAMYQSLDGLLEALPEKFTNSFSEIFIDECHHSGAQSFENIYNHFSHCLRAGWTATLYRGDNRPLGKYFNDMYEPIKMTEAINKGYICKPVIIIPDEYKNFVPEKDRAINTSEQKELIKEKKIIGDIPKIYKEIFDGLPVIVPCSTHEHAKMTTEMMKKHGWQVDHIHSKMGKSERKGILRHIRSGKTNILITVGVGIEGMDIPGLYGIIWLRFTESLTIFMQFNGRAMRPMAGKKYFILVDPVGNCVLHGRPDINRKWSLDTSYIPGQDTEETERMKLCPNCSVMVAHDVLSCWVCGYDFESGLLNGVPIDKKKRGLPKMVDGELVYLDKEDDDGVRNNDNSIADSNSIDTDRHQGNLTKAEKIKILSRDLTGLKTKNRFKEGLKWL